jgi:phosphate:Na+ symporter
MTFTAKREKPKFYGMMIMGIGLVFYGMGLMSSAMTPLRSYEPFLEILKGLENPMAGILAGAVFTAIVQSSAATVGIAIAMASEGLLALPAGIALALGANIGTAVTTAIMGVMSSKSTEAVRASAVHVMFNVVGVLLWLPLIWLLTDIAVWISPSSPELEGSARAAAEVPRQIANANTFFNVINTLLFIGFTGWFARAAERLIPERATPEGVLIEPEFLETAALAAPSMALQQVRLEIGRIGKITLGMMHDLQPAIRNRDDSIFTEIARREDSIDILEAEILNYLAKLRQGSLTDQESHEFQSLMMALDNLESLADIINSDIVPLVRKAFELRSVTGEETKAQLVDIYGKVSESVELAVQAILENDQHAAESVLLMKDEIRDLSEHLVARKAERLAATDPDYIKLVRLEMSFVEQMRRIYTLSKRIAKVVVPPVLAQQE